MKKRTVKIPKWTRKMIKEHPLAIRYLEEKEKKKYIRRFKRRMKKWGFF